MARSTRHRLGRPASAMRRVGITTAAAGHRRGGPRPPRRTCTQDQGANNVEARRSLWSSRCRVQRQRPSRPRSERDQEDAGRDSQSRPRRAARRSECAPRRSDDAAIATRRTPPTEDQKGPGPADAPIAGPASPRPSSARSRSRAVPSGKLENRDVRPSRPPAPIPARPGPEVPRASAQDEPMSRAQ